MKAGRCAILNSVDRFRACQPLKGPGLAGSDVSISVAVTKLLEAKSAGNRRAEYLAPPAHYCGSLQNGRESKPLADFTTADIEDWLKQFPSAYSRQTWLNRISTLFSFGVRREFCPANPCNRIERITVDRKAPKILSPGESLKLLKIVPALCFGYLVLGLFAGIRPDELLRLDWQDVNLITQTVTVNDAKTRRRRIVPLHGRAVALLDGKSFSSGPVAPSNSTVRRFKRMARCALGWPSWPSDLLRHSFASYALALHKDAGKVSTMMGNSNAILLSHYHEPVNEADCREFWGLT